MSPWDILDYAMHTITSLIKLASAYIELKKQRKK